MRRLIAAAALMAAGLAPAIAQPVPPGANPYTGARPGNVIGTGNSLPMSNRASNIFPGDTRSLIAPRLPNPSVPENAPPREFLVAARQALQAGQTGIAQEALERAEARQLDRSVPPSQASEPIRGPIVTEIHAAIETLGRGDLRRTIEIIDGVLQKLPPA